MNKTLVAALMLTIPLAACKQAPGDKMGDEPISRYIDKETGVACYTSIGPNNSTMSCVQIKEGEQQ